MPMREQSRIKADTVAEECTCPGPAGTPHDAKCPSLQPDRAAKEAPAPAPKTCGSPVSGGRNCGDTTVATGSPITIVCGRCRTGRPPVDGARCRVCGHYETSIEHATEKYAHCPSCGRAPHWMPVKDDDPANNSKHSEWEVHPTGTVAKILASEPIPAPAPEPSAPPTGVPVCKAWCGTKGKGGDCEPACFGSFDHHWCSYACCEAGRPLNPPHGDPVTVATGGVPLDFRSSAETFMRTHFEWHLDGDGCEDDDDMEYATDDLVQLLERTARGALVPIDTARSVPPGPVPLEALREDEARRRDLEPVDASQSNPTSNPTDNLYPMEGPELYSNIDACRGCGGPLLPENRRIADGCPCNSRRGVNHGLVPKNTCTCVECDAAQTGSTRYPPLPAWPCAAPGINRADWPGVFGAPVAPPAAPASEPAVRPLSERWLERLPWLMPEWRAEVAALEAELADEKAAHDMTRDAVKVAVDCENAAHAEVEQLRGKLAEAGGELQFEALNVSLERNQAAARVRSMREAAANVARGWRGGGPMTDEIAAAIKRLPLDIGTATDTFAGMDASAIATGREAVVYTQNGVIDAIKAAVDKERKRCLAWVSWVEGAEEGGIELRAHIRSGEDAPGAGTSAKGE